MEIYGVQQVRTLEEIDVATLGAHRAGEHVTDFTIDEEDTYEPEETYVADPITNTRLQDLRLAE